jgi:hypothetical protein
MEPECFNMLVKEIRTQWTTKTFKNQHQIRQKAAMTRYKSYSRYVDSLFRECPRQAIVFIDLYYETPYFNFNNINTVQKDLSHLLNNKRCNSIFQRLKGYIAKLDYNINKGIYCRVLFFFEAINKNDGYPLHLAEDLGDYWRDVITQGRGTYYDFNNNINFESNYSWSSFLHVSWQKYSIGIIDSNEQLLVLKYKLIKYLFGMDEFIKPKFNTKIRQYRRGDFPNH